MSYTENVLIWIIGTIRQVFSVFEVTVLSFVIAIQKFLSEIFK